MLAFQTRTANENRIVELSPLTFIDLPSLSAKLYPFETNFPVLPESLEWVEDVGVVFGLCPKTTPTNSLSHRISQRTNFLVLPERVSRKLCGIVPELRLRACSRALAVPILGRLAKILIFQRQARL